ncbi:MAG TPA: AcrB/AcrD/AcrF family protein [Bdellovibrionales bacterium]|nr:MAG: hypothetical protein A2Z97_00070 [Bdellovibrionales bacterium GWB1_52_6]OFZ04114.1 MAG: hypothetical protein A2X97_15045 [Bdellovibrionales bacterium GWA1_52_35]OFZ36954.1 MAG: hypothetical protein A2070_00030 [Bdellovibrionales bacterium GWC1_52_8]HAR42176.1 AcrB/AcrD/AcrF family protein [Bdellovibrionales bacterium]HCM39798.1 AcrB/AcrD/AcrF family protein [Bdellovibrionales bacterium]
MSLAQLAIKRPTFITSLVIIIIAVGLQSMSKLGVDLFPNLSFPFVTITTIYPGAGPAEIETLVSKPLEDQMSTVSGIKRLSSINMEGVSRVIAEFTMETDAKYAEAQVRDRASAAKKKMPLEVQDPIIRRLDPADQPILILSVNAELAEGELFDVADDFIRPKLEQVAQVGLVEVLGGRKREIRVALDRDKLKARELSVTAVAGRLAAAGENVPLGKTDQGKQETVFRSIGEFRSLSDIKNTIVNFFGSDIPTTISEIGTVEDSLADETSRAFINGKKALFIYAYRQSGSNTIAVVDALKKRIEKLNTEMVNLKGKPTVSLVRDGSIWIRANVTDVEESILLGITLAVLVVFFFLGNGRSTIITGLALPNSLIGAFILMQLAGFTINIMTLLALSLSVGLLIDDAIVVRENIFRHIEMGKDPKTAALEGTKEVTLAVIATTLAVIAVFGPVGFLSGIVGQFFREFGLTICFAMGISLFDALTMAPMLSAYFAGSLHKNQETRSIWSRTVGRAVRKFDHFQNWLEDKYGNILHFTLRRPLFVLSMSFLVFILSFATVLGVPKTFLPPQDAGEFTVGFDLPPGTNLSTMHTLATQVDETIRANKEIEMTALTVGGRNGESNMSDIYVRLVPSKQRKVNTSQVRELLREQLKPFAYANPKVKDFDPMGFGMRPFAMVILGNDQTELERIGKLTAERLKKHRALKDVDTDFRPGKPELQIVPTETRMKALGISSKTMGQELRGQIEGFTPAKFRENGREYDIRVRLKDDQRNLKDNFAKTYVPNMNFNLVRLTDVATAVEKQGPATINRQDRARYIQISADLTPGQGMGEAIDDIHEMFKTDVPLPQGYRYSFIGQAENFQELAMNMLLAGGFGTLFIFLILASLYESFITPFTIMLALPLALCGSFVALFIAGESLNIFSMIGTIMLLGVASKNSILLVDYANQLIQSGKTRSEAMIIAGKTRLRPILMTTMALIAGTFPIALGLNEASRQRTGMGVAIVGGLISSTVLTLVVIPAAYAYIDRFRIWVRAQLSRIFMSGASAESKDEAS